MLPTEPFYITCTPEQFPLVEPTLTNLGFTTWGSRPISTIADDPRFPQLYELAVIPSEHIVRGLIPSGFWREDYLIYTVTEFLALVPSEPILTNEQVLALFLKHHRKYTAFKRYCNPIHIDYVADVIDYAFAWRDTPEDHIYWSNLNDEWISLCDHFNLTGSIDLSNLS